MGVSKRKVGKSGSIPVSCLLIVALCVLTGGVSTIQAQHDDENHAAQEAEDAAGEADHGGDAEHAGGVPMDWQSDLALWSLIVFLIFLAVLKKFAWVPLAAGLDERESGIRQDIADAESARLKAEAMLAQHAAKLDQVQDEVREIIAEARRDAEHTKQSILEEAQREADASKDRAIAEINRARVTAESALFDQVADLVGSATEHVLARSIRDDDQNRLIEEALSQFSQD